MKLCRAGFASPTFVEALWKQESAKNCEIKRIAGATKYLHSYNHLHLRGVHRCNRCFNLSIEVRFDICGIQFNDESEPRGLLADVLGRLRLPPTRHWVDCKHASLGEIRGSAPQLVDVQTPHVASVPPINPTITVAYSFSCRVIRQPVYPSLELRLILIGAVELETKIVRRISEL
jgi:hypothetical protein